MCIAAYCIHFSFNDVVNYACCYHWSNANCFVSQYFIISNGFHDSSILCGAQWLSGRMPDSRSSEPGFESPFANVSKIGHFRSLN